MLERIRASYDKLSREELLDLICYISKTYIVEQTIPFDIPIPEKEEEPPDAEVIAAENAPRTGMQTPAQRFATLIEGLKKRTQLPQLEHFSVEDGRAVLIVDNQKVTFGDRVTVEFVPSRGRPAQRASSPAVPVPLDPTAPAPARPAPQPQAPPSPPGARRDLPGGDGRIHQGKPPTPTPAPPPKKKEKEGGDLADVDHIVERFKRLDLD